MENTLRHGRGYTRQVRHRLGHIGQVRLVVLDGSSRQCGEESLKVRVQGGDLNPREFNLSGQTVVDI